MRHGYHQAIVQMGRRRRQPLLQRRDRVFLQVQDGARPVHDVVRVAPPFVQRPGPDDETLEQLRVLHRQRENHRQRRVVHVRRDFQDELFVPEDRNVWSTTTHLWSVMVLQGAYPCMSVKEGTGAHIRPRSLSTGSQGRKGMRRTFRDGGCRAWCESADCSSLSAARRVRFRLSLSLSLMTWILSLPPWTCHHHLVKHLVGHLKRLHQSARKTELP